MSNWEIFKRVIWRREGGYWLFYWTLIYTVIALYSVFVEPVAQLEYIQAAWLLVCSLPLWIKPLARFLNMRTLWK
jgi:hypothetical protein